MVLNTLVTFMLLLLQIKILCTKTEFKVAVNQSHLLEFKHRINSLKSINRVSIFGDLSLSSIHVET